MKTLKYILLPILLLSTSCYIYKPYSENEDITANSGSSSPSPNSISAIDNYQQSNQKTSLNPKNERELEEKERKRMQDEDKEKYKKEAEATTNNMTLGTSDGISREGSRRGKQEPKDNQEPQIEKGIKGKLQPNKFYKVTARDKQFKIQVDKWEGDSLVSHIIRKPQKVVKLHKDEINEELILERRFSKPFSDLFTVGAYVAGAAAVLLIVL